MNELVSIISSSYFHPLNFYPFLIGTSIELSKDPYEIVTGFILFPPFVSNEIVTLEFSFPSAKSFIQSSSVP